MASKPVPGTSYNPPIVPPSVPGSVPEKSIILDPPNQPVLRSVAHDKNCLPLDLFELIFEHFIPHSSAFRHRYDAAPFSVLYQPTLVTFARLSGTCKTFQDLVTYFRFKKNLIEFRKQGSRLEFENMLRRKNKTGQSDTRSEVRTMDASSTSTSSKTTSAGLTPSSSAGTWNTGALQSIEDMRKNCRLRYGIDPVVPGLAHTPQRALVHIILGPSDLASSELKTHLQKEWQPEKRHMVFVDKLASDADCVKLASVLLEKVAYQKITANVKRADDMEESRAGLVAPDANHDTLNGFSRRRAADVEELDINLITPNLKQLPLAEAIAQCTSLLHLELFSPDLDMLQALTSLANLQSLKLQNCNVDGGPFQILANAKFKDTLQCLSVAASEFQLEHLEALRDMAGRFTNLRDLRLYPRQNGIDSVAASELAQVLPAFAALDSFSISYASSNVMAQVMPALQKLEAFRQLEFNETSLTEDECAALFLQLPGLPLLESLVLSAPLNQATASQLRIMLEKNTCCLQYLRLRNCDLEAGAVTEFAAGLNANRSLKSLILGGANLDQASATILGQAVGNHPGLLDVQIWSTTTTGSTTSRLLKGALASGTLMALDLACNGWRPEAEQAVLGLLKANTSLIRLVLPDAHTDKFAREAHAQVLAANCSRGKVWARSSSS